MEPDPVEPRAVVRIEDCGCQVFIATIDAWGVAVTITGSSCYSNANLPDAHQRQGKVVDALVRQLPKLIGEAQLDREAGHCAMALIPEIESFLADPRAVTDDPPDAPSE